MLMSLADSKQGKNRSGVRMFKDGEEASAEAGRGQRVVLRRRDAGLQGGRGRVGGGLRRAESVKEWAAACPFPRLGMPGGRAY